MNNNEILSVLNQIPSQSVRDITTHRVAELKAVAHELTQKMNENDGLSRNLLHIAITEINAKIDNIIYDVLKRYNLSGNNDL